MRDDELIDAVAAGLRAYATAPLSTCKVHAWDQTGYEGTAGHVVVRIASGSQTHIALGDTYQSLEDTVAFEIIGILPEADTAVNRRNMVLLREQIVDWLRDNRVLTAGGHDTLTNAESSIDWTYGTSAEGDKLRRYCTVAVTYSKQPDA